MKEKEILRKTLLCGTLGDDFQEIPEEDRELYLFLRGGFGAK